MNSDAIGKMHAAEGTALFCNNSYRPRSSETTIDALVCSMDVNTCVNMIAETAANCMEGNTTLLSPARAQTSIDIANLLRGETWKHATIPRLTLEAGKFMAFR